MNGGLYRNLAITFFFISVGLVWLGFRMRYGDFLYKDLYSLFYYLMLAPFAEELFFRGVLQSWLKRRLGGVLLGIGFANIVVSVIFAICHIPFWGIFHSILVFIPSLIFGFVFDRTGRIIYPLMIHSVYNLNVFIV